jgi:hypothetical protein
MLLEQFGTELDVAGLVDSVDVSKACSDGEVRRHRGLERVRKVSDTLTTRKRLSSYHLALPHLNSGGQSTSDRKTSLSGIAGPAYQRGMDVVNVLWLGVHRRVVNAKIGCIVSAGI